jgi:hypothetical protein
VCRRVASTLKVCSVAKCNYCYRDIFLRALTLLISRIMNSVIRLNAILFRIIVLSVAAPYRLDNTTLSITIKKWPTQPNNTDTQHYNARCCYANCLGKCCFKIYLAVSITLDRHHPW